MVKSQLHPKVPKLKSSAIIWTGVVHTKFQLIWTKDEEVLLDPRIEFGQYFGKSPNRPLVGRWVGGQKATSPKCSET